MMLFADANQTALGSPNTVEHGDSTLEFVAHADKTESELMHRKKVQDLLMQMYVRAKKRGRPTHKEEQEVA